MQSSPFIGKNNKILLNRGTSWGLPHQSSTMHRRGLNISSNRTNKPQFINICLSSKISWIITELERVRQLMKITSVPVIEVASAGMTLSLRRKA